MNQIMLIGEAWGREEAERKRPFVGPSGGVLKGMLAQVGIEYRECYVTNVFNLQPQPKNDIKNLCGKKDEGIPGMPSLSQGKYVRAEYEPELKRCWQEIEDVKPNVIVALGGTAAWATLQIGAITKVRGTTHLGYRGIKVLPTYHPALVMRQWFQRPIVLSDLSKAKDEAEFSEIRRPRREIWIEPDLDDIGEFFFEHIEPSDDLSIDIETIGDQITCVGFSPTVDRALVIPFYDPAQPDGNYWRTQEEELVAWEWVRRMCMLDKPIKVGQNFMYDMHRLWRGYGIEAPNTHDTMLLHHALQPEMLKGLDFLASIYTREAKWKFMRGDTGTLKRED